MGVRQTPRTHKQKTCLTSPLFDLGNSSAWMDRRNERRGGSEGENFKRSVSGEWYDEGFIKDR